MVTRQSRWRCWRHRVSGRACRGRGRRPRGGNATRAASGLRQSRRDVRPARGLHRPVGAVRAVLNYADPDGLEPFRNPDGPGYGFKAPLAVRRGKVVTIAIARPDRDWAGISIDGRRPADRWLFTACPRPAPRSVDPYERHWSSWAAASPSSGSAAFTSRPASGASGASTGRRCRSACATPATDPSRGAPSAIRVARDRPAPPLREGGESASGRARVPSLLTSGSAPVAAARSRAGSRRGRLGELSSCPMTGRGRGRTIALWVSPRPPPSSLGFTTTCARARGRCRRFRRARRAPPCPRRTARSRRSGRSPRSARGASTSG